MSLKSYLNFFNDSFDITLVGPMLKQVRDLHEPLVFIDGGSKFKGKEGICVGDGDSSDMLMDEKLEVSKDYSDLSYVLNFLEKFKKINLYGFLGGRRDHELMNFAEVHRFLMNKRYTEVFFDEEVMAFSAGSYELNINGSFSLYCFDQAAVTLSGNCDYPIETTLKANSSHGLSNHGDGAMELSSTLPIFLFRN